MSERMDQKTDSVTAAELDEITPADEVAALRRILLQRENETEAALTALRRERDEALTLLAEERAKHALTLMHYEGQQPAPAPSAGEPRASTIKECTSDLLAMMYDNTVEDPWGRGWNAAVHDSIKRIQALDAAPAPSAGETVLRYCDYCKSWQGKPCGEGCVWTPDMPTALAAAPTTGEPVRVLECFYCGNGPCEHPETCPAPAPSAGETVLVPREPTETMLSALPVDWESLTLREIWNCFLAAAPTTGEPT